MIKELGQVSEVGAGGVWVTTIQQSTCNACQAKHGCGQRLLNQIGAAKASIWAELSPELGCEVAVGDWVEVGIEEGAIVIGSLLAYGAPVVLLVLGATLGQGSGWASVMGAALGLVVGAALSRYILRTHIKAHFFQPVVLGLAQPEQRVTLIGS